MFGTFARVFRSVLSTELVQQAEEARNLLVARVAQGRLGLVLSRTRHHVSDASVAFFLLVG
jgi:hypothetical protein